MSASMTTSPLPLRQYLFYGLCNLLLKAEIIYNVSPRLVFERSIYSGQCLHQPVPLIGLSIYIVDKEGASNPVNHMSHTIATLKSPSGSLNRLASWLLRVALRMCSPTIAVSRGTSHDDFHLSLVVPFRIPIGPFLANHVVQSYQILRVAQTIITFPSGILSLRSSI